MSAPKNYVYWVSYAFGNGFGAAEFIAPGPITTSEDIAAFRRAMAGTEKAALAGVREDTIIVIAFTFMRTEAVPS